MPDPVACLLAVLAAGGTGAIVVCALGWPGRPASPARINAAGMAGTAAGLAAGYAALRLQPGWPPATGLDRFLTIVLPAVIGVELLAALPRLPGRVAVLLRIGLALSAARILLHGSVYLGGAADGATGPVVVLLAVVGALLTVEWCLLLGLSQRAPGVAIPLALAESLVCGGVAVMLAGYLRGGEAALPPAAALTGAALASAAISRHAAPAAIGIGLTALFGVLFLGRFFGALPTGQALAVFLAPLACWAAEHRTLAGQTPWRRLFLRLGLVAVPLVVVLVQAERHFEREFRPLISQAMNSPSQPVHCGGDSTIITPAP
ncbi:MAG TPA: hypothetical protein VG125_23215 [Pirellulales bacterium]|jgi:hypothetical protein|nr:hypothetical protein [Pirellulales bacterium]